MDSFIAYLGSMKKYLKFFKNKYILAITVFLVYNLFLDDVDIFTIINQNSRLSKLHANDLEISKKLKETKYTLKQLRHGYALEKYAREEKLFKKDDEDIFIITHE
jgi:cell division protein FtsB